MDVVAQLSTKYSMFEAISDGIGFLFIYPIGHKYGEWMDFKLQGLLKIWNVTYEALGPLVGCGKNLGQLSSSWAWKKKQVCPISRVPFIPFSPTRGQVFNMQGLQNLKAKHFLHSMR